MVPPDTGGINESGETSDPTAPGEHTGTAVKAGILETGADVHSGRGADWPQAKVKHRVQTGDKRVSEWNPSPSK